MEKEKGEKEKSEKEDAAETTVSLCGDCPFADRLPAGGERHAGQFFCDGRSATFLDCGRDAVSIEEYMLESDLAGKCFVARRMPMYVTGAVGNVCVVDIYGEDDA